MMFLAIVFVLYDIRGRNRRSHYRLLFAFSDILTIQAVVYILNFVLTGKCGLTTYHYFVALDSLLLFCSTMVLVFVTSRHHYWETLLGPFRFLATLVIFGMLSIFIGYQTFRHGTSDFPNWKPSEHNDTVLLLPVSCFLDPDLISSAEFGNPYAPNQTVTDAQLDQIGRPVKTYQLPEIWIFWILALCLVLGVTTCCCLAARPHNKLPVEKSRECWWIMWLTLAACFATDVFCAYHIFKLRKWASTSGWLENGEEGELSPFSQLMAVASLVLLAFALIDHVPLRGPERHVPNHHGYAVV
ncbi:hypothetical protein V2W45_1438384 [Cenococcum geophilum]